MVIIDLPGEQNIRIDSLNLADVEDIRLDILRLDLIDPIISGNKWFKLKYNVEYALNNQYDSILTFGGAYSNHLIATAAAAKKFGLKSIGIVRGSYHQQQLTPTLIACEECGMKLHYVTHAEYDQKTDTIFLKNLQEQFPEAYIIPEGGANDLGRKGSMDIAKFISNNYSHIIISAGTGTTLAGLRETSPVQQKILGFAPMKQGKYLQTEIAKHISPPQNQNWRLIDDFHFGGFGKITDELLFFMNDFFEQNKIMLDRVYTAKMMFGIQKMIRERYFPGRAEILCIHTGGLQGNNSIKS